MTSVIVLADTVVAPDWQLLAWAVLVFVVIVLIATLMWHTRKPKPRRRSGDGAGHDAA
jgi:uncharacterized membrane protein